MHPRSLGQIRAPHALESGDAPSSGPGVACEVPDGKNKRADKWGTVTPDQDCSLEVFKVEQCKK